MSIRFDSSDLCSGLAGGAPLSVLLLLIVFGMPARAGALYSENFEAVSAGAQGDFSGAGFVSVEGTNKVYRIEGIAEADNVFTAGASINVLTLQADVTWQSDGGPNFLFGLSTGASDPVSQFGGSHDNPSIGGILPEWRFRSSSLSSTFSSSGYPASSATNRTDTFLLTYDFVAGTLTAAFDDGADGSGFLTIGSISMGTSETAQSTDSIFIRGGAGTAFFDNIIVTEVPEPATLLMLTIGLAAVGFGRHARRDGYG